MVRARDLFLPVLKIGVWKIGKMRKAGIDLDDVVYDIQGEMIDIYNELFGGSGEDLTRENWTKYFLRYVASFEKEKRVLEVIAEKRAYRNIRLIPFAREALEKIAKNHEIFFITERGSFYPEAKQDTLYALKKDEIPFSEIIFTSEKAGAATRHKLEWAVEDKPSHALSLAKVCPCYVFDYPYNRVKDMEEKNGLIRIRGFKNETWWLNLLKLLGIGGGNEI